MSALGEVYFKSVKRSTQVRCGVEGLGRQITGGRDFETLTDQAVGDGPPIEREILQQSRATLALGRHGARTQGAFILFYLQM